ncbi:MAG: hypothetical protein DIZ77_01980, partial [endosymbiont of Seepiophila jonesi]
MNDRAIATQYSALWSAYGDALGFITELTDKKGLKWRTGLNRVDHTVKWQRRIGGRFGLVLDLPVGCYSDDTQLRLATARAINSNGRFDAESFAKIELTVWPSYALGAGRASKAAAANLGRGNVNWFSNFYETAQTSYLNSGGNGVAMRIQPHVWASADLRDYSGLAMEILRNGICTHGHPRALAGAVLHGWFLAETLRSRSIP